MAEYRDRGLYRHYEEYDGQGRQYRQHTKPERSFEMYRLQEEEDLTAFYHNEDLVKLRFNVIDGCKVTHRDSEDPEDSSEEDSEDSSEDDSDDSEDSEEDDGIVGDEFQNCFKELFNSETTHTSTCSEPLRKADKLCECARTKLDQTTKKLKDIQEPRLVNIFKTYVATHVYASKKDSTEISREIMRRFHDLCLEKGYSELGKITFSIKMPPARLEEYLHKRFDDMSDKFMAVIISEMKSDRVQSFFSSSETRGHERLGEIIKNRHLTLQKLLDKMAVQKDQVDYVNCKILEMDNLYRTPEGDDYNFLYQTVYQKIAYAGIEDAICHRAFYRLTNKKWEKWCKRAFTIDAITYLFSVVLLTFDAVASVNASDVGSYQSPIDYVRAVVDTILTLNAVRILGTEIYQVFRLKKGYLLDKMNIFEFVAPTLILLVLILRYIHEQAHWFMYAAAYLVWLLQIVKFAPVFKFTGVYVDSLRIMIIDDIIKFAILIVISILIFSGTFVLILKAENTLERHEETKSFWKIFLVGLRIMIESDSIIEYTGDDGYKTAGVMAMMVFMFFIIVVLLNMLIAQLINTYQKIESSSLKGFYVRRAQIVARLEREQLPFMFNNDGKRKDNYEEGLRIDDGLASVSDTGILYEDPMIQMQHMREDVQCISETMEKNDTKIVKLEKQLSSHKTEFRLMFKILEAGIKVGFSGINKDLNLINVIVSNYLKTIKTDKEFESKEYEKMKRKLDNLFTERTLIERKMHEENVKELRKELKEEKAKHHQEMRELAARREIHQIIRPVHIHHRTETDGCQIS